MSEQEAIAETLGIAVMQLRKASNLIKSRDDNDRWEASELILHASNTIVTARWMMARKDAE